MKLKRGRWRAAKGKGASTSRWASTRVSAWLPAALWAALIFVLSSVPGDGLPPLPGVHVDKLIHAAVYSVLGIFCFRALARTTPLRRLPLVAVAAALAGLYGASDELHQMFTPGRSPDLADVLADVIGGLLGSGFMAWTRRRDG